MELRAYLRIMIARWWIVLPALLVTFGASAALTSSQVPLYESMTTYVVKVRVSTADEKALVSAVDTLGRNQIAATFAEVANSRLIKAKAGDELGLSGGQLQAMSVNSRPLAGTNVVQIAVQGPEPALARDLASAIGAQTATYLRGLYGPYELQLLDQATLPSSPAKPNVALNLLFGALAGLILGAGLAFLSEYLQAAPADELVSELAPDDARPVRPAAKRHEARSRKAGAPANTEALAHSGQRLAMEQRGQE
jgi:capsular polysaccharide biosynthesis protein